MGLSVKVDSFLWAASDTAGTTYDRTLGFQPTMLLIWACGSPSATDLIQRQSSITGWGFGVSSTDRRAACFGSGDNLATAILFIRHADNCVLTLPSVTGADGGALDIAAEASWPADGIRFVVDTPAGGDIIVHVLAFGGTDITAAKTLAFQEPAATGAQTIAHGLGTTPTGVLFASVGFGTAPPSGSAAQGMFMCGASDGTNNWVCFRGGDDGNTTMDTASYAKSGECIALAPEPAVTLNARASCTGLDATNITLNWAERAATRYVFALVWAGGQFTAANTLTRTNTTQFDGPTCGFTPAAALFASACGAESTADTPTPHAHLSLGAATSSTERVCQSVLDEDGVGTSEVTVTVQYDEVYAHISTASAIEALMDVANLGVDPMQLVMDDAETSTQSFVGVAAWGAAAAGGSTYPQTVAGTLASTGTAAKQIRRALAGTTTTTGLLLKQPRLALAGALTSAGLLASVKTALKALAGTVAIGGALSRRAGKVSVGTLAAAGSLTKRVARALTGTMSSAGVTVAVKTALKSLTGSLSVAGTVSKQTRTRVSGTLLSAGSLAKRTARALSGVLSAAGALAGQTLGTQFTQALTGTWTLSGSLARQTGKVVAGSLGSSSALARRTARSLTGTLAPAGGIAKQIRRTIAGVLGWVGSLVGVNRGAAQPHTITLTGRCLYASTIDVTGTCTYAPTITLAGSVVWADAITLEGTITYGD